MLAATSLQFTQPGRDDRMQPTNPYDYAIAASAGLRVPNDSPTRPSWVLAPATRPRGHESAQRLCSSSTTTCASRASSSHSQQPYVANRLEAGPAAVTPALANEKRASPGTSYVARPPPPPPQQQQQQGVHRERPAVRFGGSGSDGGGGGASNGDVGGRPRRWQYTNYSRHSYGEEDFEFLRSLLNEASDPRSPGAGAATAAAASSVAFPVAAAAARASPAVVTPPSASLTTPTPLLKENPPPWPFASSMAMEARLRATLAARTLSGGRDGDADSSAVVESDAQKSTAAIDGGDDNVVGYGVTAEDKLRAADDVAACIWLAGDRLREGLIARVRDTWGAAEAEMAGMTSAGCEGCSGSVVAAAAGPTARQRTPPLLSSAQHGAPRNNLRQVFVNRMETTRKAVEAELKAADEAAAARGEDTVLCDPKRWRGCTALREDVLATLEGFQAENDRDPMVGETALYSTVSCREELLKRLKRTQDAVVAKVITINGAGGPGSRTRGDKNPAIIDNVAMKEVDGLTKGLLEQLEANHAAAEEERRPSDSSGDLRDGLLARLESTRAAAAAELLKDAGNNGTSINNEATSATGTGSEGGVDYVSDGLGGQGGGGGGMWERGGRQDGAARESEKRGLNSPGAAGATAGGAAGVGTRKRKRAGSGGRRCKHEDCTLHPHFGLTRPEYCSRHKLPGMFNVKGRRCVNLECKRTPVYGKAGDPHPTYCAAHKLADMVDIKNPTCREATCPRQPSFGSPHDRRATYCATHMLAGMVNVRRMLASSKSTSKKAKPAKTASSTASGGGGGKKAATTAAGRWV